MSDSMVIFSIIFFFNCAFFSLGAATTWMILNKRYDEEELLHRILLYRLLSFRLPRWSYGYEGHSMKFFIDSLDRELDHLYRFPYKPEIRPKTVSLYAEGYFNAYLEDMRKKNDEELP